MSHNNEVGRAKYSWVELLLLLMLTQTTPTTTPPGNTDTDTHMWPGQSHACKRRPSNPNTCMHTRQPKDVHRLLKHMWENTTRTDTQRTPNYNENTTGGCVNVVVYCDDIELHS